MLGERSALAAIDEVRGRRLDGLVFIGHDDQGVPRDLSQAVGEYDVPFVAVDCGTSEGIGRNATVDFDYGVGVRQVFSYLVACGIRRVLYVRPDIESPAEAMRLHAILEEERLHPDVTIQTVRTGVTADAIARLDSGGVRQGANSAVLSDRVIRALSTGAADPSETAVVCAWGADAEAAYRSARSHDSRVRVAALAAGALTVQLWPGLAYSRLPLEEGGRESARLIIASSRGADAPERVVLTPSLISND